MTPARLFTLLATLVALVLTALPVAADDDLEEEDLPVPRVVVAPIDTGINPYHELFQRDEDSLRVDEHVLEEFGIDEDHILHITAAGYDADDAAGVYAGVQEGEAYWFAGTNIIAWSSGFGSRPFLPNSSGNTHGTGVTGAVVNANPDAIIYFVEGTGAAGETEAFTNPAVDIVTTSYGFATSAPLGALNDSWTGVVEEGKLHFGAAANDPTLAPTDGTAGPWWVIGIAGYAEGDGDAKELTSGTAPDFVGDFTQDLPYCDVCTSGTQSVSGTSFATPRSAGVASTVLLRAREAAGHLGGITEEGLMVDAGGVQLTNWELRRALEEGAHLPGTSPFGGGFLPDWTDMGWGAITADPDADVVGRTLGYLADGEALKSADTCQFMTAYMTSRYLLWDVNPLSDSFGQTNALGGSPYIPC